MLKIGDRFTTFDPDDKIIETGCIVTDLERLAEGCFYGTDSDGVSCQFPIEMLRWDKDRLL